jgi:hypothetical protein
MAQPPPPPASGPAAPATPSAQAKHLKAAHLAVGESLLRETRATKLFYFPLPVFLLVIVGFFTYSAAAATYGWPGPPYLTDWLSSANSFLGDHYLLITFLFLLLITVLFFVYRYIRFIRTVYAVTNRRVIVQSGILSKDFDEIPILQVRGVDVHQSVVQRMLGYGTVRISAEEGSKSSIGNEDWKGIPKPFQFQRLIEESGDALRLRVGGNQ